MPPVSATVLKMCRAARSINLFKRTTPSKLFIFSERRVNLDCAHAYRARRPCFAGGGHGDRPLRIHANAADDAGRQRPVSHRRRLARLGELPGLSLRGAVGGFFPPLGEGGPPRPAWPCRYHAFLGNQPSARSVGGAAAC